MAVAPSSRSASFEAEYPDHRDFGLEYLRRHWPQFQPHDREDVVDEVFRSLVERELSDGFVPIDFRPYFTKALERRAKHELRKRHGRATDPSDPQQGALPELGDDGIADQVIGKLDAENLTAIINALNPLQRACARMRFHYDLMPREIAQQLGIDQRKVDKALERATARIRRQVDEGDFGRRYGELIERLVAGTATPRQAAEALALIKTSSQARMIHTAMLRDGRELGALLGGTPLATTEPTRSRFVESLTHAKQQVLDATSATKGHATSAYVRTIETTQNAGQYVSSARPGAATALVATCLAASGGVTICAVNGVDPLDALRDPPASTKNSPNQARSHAVAKRPAAVVKQAPPVRQERRRSTPKPPRREPRRATGTARPRASGGSMNFGGLGGAPDAPAPAPRSVPSPTPAPTASPSASQAAPASGGGEFGGLSP